MGADKLSAEQRRIRELERELAIAKMERDILKKVRRVCRTRSFTQINALAALRSREGERSEGCEV